MDMKLIAGPILRRTTTNRVCVWLATSRPMTLQLTIVDAQNTETEYGQSKLDEIDEQCVKAGDNLYVYLLQARSNTSDGYLLDKLMCYRLDEVNVENNIRTPLFSADELQKLVYGSLPYPSFFIPSQLKHILHGSCRKPHGGLGNGDALVQAEAQLAEQHSSVGKDDAKRPALLLLTGDQIYADDVAVSLAAVLKKKATELTGAPETLPGISLPDLKLHGRTEVLKEEKSGFSSTESHNHLFSFGEFAAMYLYTFGNVQTWTLPTRWEDIGEHALPEAEEEFNKQNDALQKFSASLGRVRKLFANIPTYMIFDDHDVTDDWNITHAWYDNVRKSSLGRRIVSNALAAYWAFQGWGNDPDNFDKDMVWSIQQRLTDSTNNPDIAERYDLQTWKHRGWGFSIPTMPPIIAMDSRTQRQYDNKNLPAQLMDRYALDWLRVEWAKLITDYKVPSNTSPVLLATAPVHSFAAIDSVQGLPLKLLKLLASRFNIVAMFAGRINQKLVNVMDIESWISNKNGFKALFDTLQDRMQLSGCTFLSGDVHYAFSSKGAFTCNEKTLDCWQLTSSALCNMPNDLNREMVEGLGDALPSTAKHGVWLAWDEKDRWSTSATLLRPQESPKPIHAVCNVGMVAFKDGKPASHTLLTGSGQLVYLL